MKRCSPWQETGTGLSGIVEGQLGMRLDKGLQCSSWGLRPLSPEQLHYAALDAAVLLMLLDRIIAAALPSRADSSPVPHGDSQVRHSSAGNIQPAEGNLDTSSDRGASHDTGAQSHGALTLLGSRADADLGQPFALDTTLEGRKTAQSNEDRRGRLRDPQDSACTASSAAQAAEALQQLSLCSITGRNAGINNADGCKSASDEQHASSAADTRRAGAIQNGREEQRSHQAASMRCADSALVPGAASAAELQEAAQLWGSRLQVGGACRQGAPKPSKEKRLGVRARLGQDAESADHLGKQRWLWAVSMCDAAAPPWHRNLLSWCS